MQGNWDGQNALIAGGSTGIGFALAAALVKEGMNVVLSFNNPDRLQAAAIS